MMANRNSSAASPSLMPPPSLVRKTGLSRAFIWGVIAVGIVAILGVAVLLYFCVWRRVFKKFRQIKTSKGPRGEKIILRRFQLEELSKATQNFSKDRLVGSGAFGNVYKGIFEVEGTLAIKKAHADSYQSVEEFRNEVLLLSRVRHRNLVRMVGYCEEGGVKGTKILVYEYVSNGSLLEYLIGSRRTLTWLQRVNLAIGAAKGLSHLHEDIVPSIIHRDIKPSNILIGEGFEAKVSDFGLVKSGPVGDASHVSTQIKGTPGYLDPAYCSSLHLSPFSDVYSFGVILLQLVTARPAVNITKRDSNYNIIEWSRTSLEHGNVEEILDANLLLEPCNMEVMLKMGQLGLRCVVKTPKQRPTMTQVWQELQQALNYSVQDIIYKQPARWPSRSIRGSHGSLTEHDSSQSFVSIDGVGLQRFQVEMDSFSIQSASLRCLESTSIDIDFDSNVLKELSEDANSNEARLLREFLVHPH